MYVPAPSQALDDPAFHGQPKKGSKEMVKKPATPRILDIYMSAKARLQTELGKAEQDLATTNNVEAFSHILREIEERYDIVGAGCQAA